MESFGLRNLIDQTPGECLVFTLRAAELEYIAWREGRDTALSREREAAGDRNSARGRELPAAHLRGTSAASLAANSLSNRL